MHLGKLTAKADPEHTGFPFRALQKEVTAKFPDPKELNEFVHSQFTNTSEISGVIQKSDERVEG